MSWLSPYTDVECCYLTTVGCRSGRLHEVEIWFGVVDDTLYMISGNGPTAHWFLNASANRHVTIRVAGETRAGEARVVDDPEERRRVGELMGAKYPWDGDPSIGLTFEAWCFDVPLLAVSRWSAAG
ncbi:MAG: nitroreductase/quinone reductase family protein [Ilumatobacteraceae bacterium]